MVACFTKRITFKAMLEKVVFHSFLNYLHFNFYLKKKKSFSASCISHTLSDGY